MNIQDDITCTSDICHLIMQLISNPFVILLRPLPRRGGGDFSGQFTQPVINMVKCRPKEFIYCGSGNFRVFRFSRIRDFVTFREVWDSIPRIINFDDSSAIIIIIFRYILKFANLFSSRNSLKLKPCEYYHIYSIQMVGWQIRDVYSMLF